MNNTEKRIQPLTLRLDADLHRHISEIARRRKRTLTGQIIYWLELGMRVEQTCPEALQKLSVEIPLFTLKKEDQ